MMTMSKDVSAMRNSREGRAGGARRRGANDTPGLPHLPGPPSPLPPDSVARLNRSDTFRIWVLSSPIVMPTSGGCAAGAVGRGAPEMNNPVSAGAGTGLVPSGWRVRHGAGCVNPTGEPGPLLRRDRHRIVADITLRRLILLPIGLGAVRHHHRVVTRHGLHRLGLRCRGDMPDVVALLCRRAPDEQPAG